MPLTNFGVVVEKLYRAAQPSWSDAETLKAIGVKWIYQLNDDYDDASEFANSGVGVVKRPMPGWAIDYRTDDIMQKCSEIRTLLEDGAVLVHCLRGRDRTGFICAAYKLMFCGATMDQVNADRKLYGVSGIVAFVDMPETCVLEEIAKRAKT